MDQIVASYPGTCPACGNGIAPGDVIVAADGTGWVHLACAQAAK